MSDDITFLNEVFGFTGDVLARIYREHLSAHRVSARVLDHAVLQWRKIAKLERELAAAQMVARDEEECAEHSGGILSDVCDILFDDEDRAATHGYDGVLERARELVKHSHTACDGAVCAWCRQELERRTP